MEVTEIIEVGSDYIDGQEDTIRCWGRYSNVWGVHAGRMQHYSTKLSNLVKYVKSWCEISDG